MSQIAPWTPVLAVPDFERSAAACAHSWFGYLSVSDVDRIVFGQDAPVQKA